MASLLPRLPPCPSHDSNRREVSTRSEGLPPFAFRAFGWGRTDEGVAMTVAVTSLAPRLDGRKHEFLIGLTCLAAGYVYDRAA